MTAKKATTTDEVVQVTDSSPEVVADDAPKTATLTSPWGTKVTVAADQAAVFKDAGYTAGK